MTRGPSSSGLRPADLVNFGLLDSHGLFSSMANVRLDGFVYTVEGIRAAWRLLNDRGVLTLAFAPAGQPWLGGKLYQMVTAATGREPRVYAWGLYRIVLIAEKQPIPNSRRWPFVSSRRRPAQADLVNPVASDDWPYLYLRAADSIGLRARDPQLARDVGGGGGTPQATRERRQRSPLRGDGYWLPPA